MVKKNHFKISSLILLLLLIWAAPGWSAPVELTPGRKKVGLAESLQIQIKVDGAVKADPDLTPLRDNWEILSQSQQTRIRSDGKKTQVHDLVLLPRQQGTLPLPAICSAEQCSAAQTVEVIAGSAIEVPVDEQIILETEISPQSLMVNGKALLKVRLWLRSKYQVGELSDPVLDGAEALLVKLQSPLPKVETRENGIAYQLVERHYEITPIKEGTLTIPPIRYVGRVVGGPTRFDPFVKNGMLVRVFSEPLEIEVAPLVKAPGQASSLSASSLTLEDDWQQNLPNLIVGEPATRTLSLRAGGVAVDDLPELSLEAPEDFKVYSDPPTREDILTGQGQIGLLVQSFTLIPTRAGTYQLPEMELSWWDTGVGQLRQARLPARMVDVQAPAEPEPAVVKPPDPPVQTLGPAAEATAPAESATLPDQVDKPLPSVRSFGDEPVRSPGFWPWLSGFLALGWLATLAGLLKQRGVRSSSTAESAARKLSKASQAKRKVIEAARRNEPEEARRALIAWSKLLWPGRPGSRYERLLQSVPVRLRRELEQLDHVLYGAAGRSWEGSSLVSLLEDWQPPAKPSETVELPPLYPSGLYEE